MLGQHQAVDFQEERILRHLLLKGRYLARGISHLTGIMQKEKKNASKSQGHTWLAFAVTKLAPLALKTLLGVGKGLHWQNLSLQVWEHLVQRCCAFWHHFLPSHRIRLSDEPQHTGKVATEWEGMGYKNRNNGVTYGPLP